MYWERNCQFFILVIAIIYLSFNLHLQYMIFKWCALEYIYKYGIYSRVCSLILLFHFILSVICFCASAHVRIAFHTLWDYLLRGQIEIFLIDGSERMALILTTIQRSNFWTFSCFIEHKVRNIVFVLLQI